MIWHLAVCVEKRVAVCVESNRENESSNIVAVAVEKKRERVKGSRREKEFA